MISNGGSLTLDGGRRHLNGTDVLASTQVTRFLQEEKFSFEKVFSSCDQILNL